MGSRQFISLWNCKNTFKKYFEIRKVSSFLNSDLINYENYYDIVDTDFRKIKGSL